MGLSLNGSESGTLAFIHSHYHSKQEASGCSNALTLSTVALSSRVSSKGRVALGLALGTQMKVCSWVPGPEEGIAESHTGPGLGPGKSLTP